MQFFDDKNCMSDALLNQKFLTSAYNMAVTESANDQLRRDFLSIYQEEQNNLKIVFDSMQARGWYQVNNASWQDISQVQNQFRNVGGQVGSTYGQGIYAGQPGQQYGSQNIAQYGTQNVGQYGQYAGPTGASQYAGGGQYSLGQASYNQQQGSSQQGRSS